MMKIIIYIFSQMLVFSIAYSNNADSLSSDKSAEISDTTYSNISDSLSSKIINKSKSEITDTTYECTLTTITKNNYPGVHISGLSDSSVKIISGKFSREIQIKDIRSIKFKGRGFWRGALLGGGTSFLIGGLLFLLVTDSTDSGSETLDKFEAGLGLGVGLAIPFAIIGGLIGQRDDYYDLRKLGFEAKREKIADLIKEFSNR